MFWKKINKALSLDEEPTLVVSPTVEVEPFGYNPSKSFEPIEVYEETPEEVINSATIQKDISYTLDNLLEEMSKPYTIEENLTLLKATKDNFERENKELSQKIQTLKDLGFDNTPSVKVTQTNLDLVRKRYEDKSKELEDSLKYNAEILKLTQEYALKYPSFKFVPREVMMQILKKYGLILGEAGMYGKEIPTTALETISQFSQQIKDSSINVIARTRGDYMTHYVDFLYTTETAEELQREIRLDATTARYHTRYHLVTTVTMLKMVAPLEHFTNRKNCVITKENILEYSSREMNAEIERRRLEDPIACLEVPMGYIILAAWDKEAEIPEIKNPLNN